MSERPTRFAEPLGKYRIPERRRRHLLDMRRGDGETHPTRAYAPPEPEPVTLADVWPTDGA